MSSRVLPLLAFFGAIAIFFFYINPLWSGAIAQTKEAIASDDEALAAAAAYTKHENELTTTRNNMNPEDLARLNVFLPDSVGNVGLIVDLNALAARTGLTLSNIDVQKSATNAAPARTTGALPSAGASLVSSAILSLAAKGTYGALHEFLRGIETSARLLDVQDIGVGGSDTGVYEYKMTIRLYWLR